MAGMRMLLSGGNAFDAAVATGFAAAVIEPTASYSLATEGGMLYYAASGTMQALSGQGVVPQAATVAAFRPWPHENSHWPRRLGVSFFLPCLGLPMAISSSWRPMARRPWVRCWHQPSIMRSTAFPCTSTLSAYSASHKPWSKPSTLSWRGGAEVFYPGGQVPAVGSLFVQPQLGQTLRLLVGAERAAPGPRRAGSQAARRMFYEGEIAHRIGAFSERVEAAAAGGFAALPGGVRSAHPYHVCWL